MEERSNGGGTQAIQRASMLLRLLARRVPHGTRLGALSKMSGLPHPTVRRILKCLIDERLVVQEGDTRHYRLGPLNFELGLASQHRLDVRDRYRPVLDNVARATGQTSYLFLRSGAEVVCLDRVEGSSVDSVATLKVGGRRPLGFSAASIVLFCEFSDDDINAYLEDVGREIESNPRVTRESIMRNIRKAREAGFGVIRDTTALGISAIGVAIPESLDVSPLAISVTAINDFWSQERLHQVHGTILSALKLARDEAA